jgi:hypothetical protein
MSTTEEDCGLARLARLILIDEQSPSKREGPKRVSVKGFAGILGLNDQQIYDKLRGRSAFRPAESRMLLAYTEDARVARWLLDGSRFQPARRPESVQVPKVVSANVPNEAPAKLHTLTWSMVNEAYALLLAASIAATDSEISMDERALLKTELADLDLAVASLRLVIEAE